MRTLVKIFVALFAVGCGAPQPGKPTGKVRVLNLFSPDGGPGPSVDVYAAPNTNPFDPVDTSQKPLISNLGYEGLSEYISPPDVGTRNSGVMAFFEAGKKSAGKFYSGAVVPGSFAEDEVALLTLYNCPNSNGEPTVCFNTLDEKATAGANAVPPQPSSGKALFYSREEAAVGVSDIYWYGNGGTCLVDNSGSQYYRAYEIASGSSNVTLLLKPGGSGNPTCMEPPTFTLPVTAAAGSRAWLFTYGASSATLKQKWIPIP